MQKPLHPGDMNGAAWFRRHRAARAVLMGKVVVLSQSLLVSLLNCGNI